MCRRIEMRRWLRAAACVVALGMSGQVAIAADAVQAAAAIGRAPTAAELKAWDIDVRGDFKGLPAGSGSVDLGSKVWEAKCASCHGDFGESNAVFTPIVGGTTKKDIESGHTAALAAGGYPHRTTLMKVSKLSSLWDYIHRAMPWNAPKSLSTDEVYGVLAYILNLGDIVPADFTLSDRNIAEVQKRLPNRDGHVFFASMWEVRGKGDVRNPPCMKDCPLEATQVSALPAAARNSNGNIAEQVRRSDRRAAPIPQRLPCPPRSLRADPRRHDARGRKRRRGRCPLPLPPAWPATASTAGSSARLSARSPGNTPAARMAPTTSPARSGTAAVASGALSRCRRRPS